MARFTRTQILERLREQLAERHGRSSGPGAARG